MADHPIDLVMPWLDDRDPAWRKERGVYSEKKDEDQVELFRDWELLRYWFRGVEKALPWIHKVHFLTWGHLPPWLDTEHPKLNIVRHEDFIPKTYRPTFSSIPISLNIHRIPGLSEQFIYTNDDFYFLAEVKQEEYFQNGLPCDCLCAQPITEVDAKGFGHILWSNIDALNEFFDMHECMQAHPDKWFSPEYPQAVLDTNLWAQRLRRFPGFKNPHLPTPMLKSTFETVWEKAHDRMHHSSLHKFRALDDCNEWLMRYWQFAEGEFIPYLRKGGRSMEISSPEEELRETLLSSKYRVICLNEGGKNVNFEQRKVYLKELFEIVFPEMSSYEKF